MAASTSSEHLIDLEKLPVTNLSQRGGQLLSLHSKNQVTPAGALHQPSSPLHASRESVHNVANDKQKVSKPVPSPDEEPSVVCMLTGSSISGYTELCGWTRTIPLKFFNIRETTRLKNMRDGTGKVITTAEELVNKCLSLREVYDLIGAPNRTINSPVYVQVIAKRTVDIVPIKNKILIIPLLVVGDKTGYCLLCSLNEGISTIYNDVEVGDYLLLTQYQAQYPKRSYHKGIFSDDMFINLEIKVQFHTVRHHFIHRVSIADIEAFKFPESLFHGLDPTIVLPNNMQRVFKTALNQREDIYLLPQERESYYDIFGVVTYVGRIERTTFLNSMSLDVIEDSRLIKSKPLQRFAAYRWIYLTDLRSSSQFPIKLYVNNKTWDYQTNVIPGAIVVLTNCKTNDCNFTEKFTETTCYTDICTHADLVKYFLLRPANFKAIMKEIMDKTAYISIMSSKLETFLVGGTHNCQIGNETEFKQFYQKNRNNLCRDLRCRPLIRRECKIIYFEGRILRFVEVKDAGRATFYNKPHPTFRTEREKKNKLQYNSIEHTHSNSLNCKTTWFTWKRVLPSIDSSVFINNRTRQIVAQIIGSWEKYTRVLLMPSQYTNDELKEDEMPITGNLEIYDGQHYFLIDIVNQEEGTWYRAMWKGTKTERENRLKKIEKAMGERVIGMIEVFCSEVDMPYEVVLCDFVIT